MKEKSIVLMVMGAAFFACAGVLGYYFAWPKYQAYAVEQANEKIVMAAQAKVAAELFDPSSAQFRNTRVDYGENVCGQVNGKNRFGAYVGFRWFKVSSSEVVIDHPDAPIQIAQIMCK